MAGMKWNRIQPASPRVFAQPRNYGRPQPVPQRVFAHRMQPRVQPQKISPAPARATIRASTVFVWVNMDGQCGLSEYVKHLASAAAGSVWCRSIDEILFADRVLIQVIHGMTPLTVAQIANMQRRGMRVVLDFHHFDPSWIPQVVQANESIVHHPSLPEATGGRCRYLPLVVPVVPRESVTQLGGITHFGIGAPHATYTKRIDVMAQVARDLGTKFFCYGIHNRQCMPPHLLPFSVFDERYHGDASLARMLRQHSVAMMGRVNASGAQSTASARFVIAAGVPMVIDKTWTHQDLEGVVDVVPFDDFAALVARVRLLVESEDARAEAIARADAYARANSPKKICEALGIPVG